MTIVTSSFSVSGLMCKMFCIANISFSLLIQTIYAVFVIAKTVIVYLNHILLNKNQFLFSHKIVFFINAYLYGFDKMQISNWFTYFWTILWDLSFLCKY